MKLDVAFERKVSKVAAHFMAAFQWFWKNPILNKFDHSGT